MKIIIYFLFLSLYLNYFLAQEVVVDAQNQKITEFSIEEQFLHSVRTGDLASITNIHGQGFDVSAVRSNGWTPIMHAISSNQIECVDLLIKLGADVNIQEKDGFVAIMFAIFHGRVSIVRLLVEQGNANLLIRNKNGSNAIDFAITRNQSDTRRYLSISGLTKSMVGQSIEEMLDFIAYGASVNTALRNGWTPLLVACFKRNIDVVRKLLDYPDINVNLVENDGWSPLMIAIHQQDLAIVQLLLDNKADINIRSKSGITALDLSKSNSAINTLLESKVTVPTVPQELRTGTLSSDPIKEVITTSTTTTSEKTDILIEKKPKTFFLDLQVRISKSIEWVKKSLNDSKGILYLISNLDIEYKMILILLAMCLLLLILSNTLTLKATSSTITTSNIISYEIYIQQATWLPDPIQNAAKYQFELFAIQYSRLWISVFAFVILWQVYEDFNANSYLYLCIPLALVFLLQPICIPLPAEKTLVWYERYSTKANVWIAIFSFIGNYWYTHYFYSVLKAKYTFPAHRLNDVPIALYFATHFYFMTYHTLSNMILRRIETRYLPGYARSIFFWISVLAFSYFTAFMETLSISTFPYYNFEDRNMAYILGYQRTCSAFYGIYFIVSFPVFYRIDESNDNKTGMINTPHTIFQTILEALGVSMLVLVLLDICRLYCGIELNIGATGYYLYSGI